MTDTAKDGFETAREKALAAALARAPFEGWTAPMLEGAARDAQIDPATLAASFPKGIADLLTFWSWALDEAMAASMAGPEFSALKIRQKVAFAVRRRLDSLRPHKEAARRAAATLALPIYAPLGMRLAWRTSDAVWRAMGDQSTDFNFYSKRVILTGVWTSTFARWLADDDPHEAATQAFLAARIDNVMQFEKAKAKVRDSGFDPEGMFGWLAKLRYKAPSSARADEDAKVDETLKGSFPASDPPYWTGGA